VSDLIVARSTHNINLIIGGHTHTFLEEPTMVENNRGKQVIVNQVGFGGINLGRIDFYIGKNKIHDNNSLLRIG
jgi:5'-nucleotidase